MKKTNKLLALILVIFMMTIVAPMAFAADDAVTLDLADGNIIITKTGYSIGGGTETAYTGDYIITGTRTSNEYNSPVTIKSVADGSDITFKDIDITMTNYAAAISFQTDATVYAEGTIKVESVLYAIDTTQYNLTIKGDADFILGATNDVVGRITAKNLDMTCKSLDARRVNTGAAVINATEKAKITAESFFVNCDITAAEFELVVDGDIVIDSMSPNPLFKSGAFSLKSTNGNILIDADYMVASTTDLSLEAKGDIIINANSNYPLINSKTVKLVAENVDVENTGTGAVVYADYYYEDNSLEIIATGDINFESASKSSVICTYNVNLSGDNITIKNGDAGQGIYAVELDIAAIGKLDVEVAGGHSGPVLNGNKNITAASMEFTSGSGNGFMFNGENNLLATDGDIVIVDGSTLSTPGVFGGPSTVKAPKGDVYITSGNGETITVYQPFDVEAKNIVINCENYTSGPAFYSGCTLKAEENITVLSGYTQLSNNPTGIDVSFSFGDKLVVTTSEGTNEHIHEYTDVEIYDDATCKTNATKLVKCDCEWPVEKTVEAENTKAEHIDADLDGFCDFDCGKALATIDGVQYEILGDVTYTGVVFGSSDGMATGYYKSGEGYLIADFDETGRLEIILNNATIDVRELSDIEAIYTYVENVEYKFYGTNNIYGNDDAAIFSSGGSSESSEITMSGIGDGVINIYGEYHGNNLIINSGTVNVYDTAENNSINLAVDLLKKLKINEGATFNVVSGGSVYGFNVGVIARRGIENNGTLNAILLDGTEDGEIIYNFTASGDAVLGGDTYNYYYDMEIPDEVDLQINFIVPEGTSVTIPEEITLNLDSMTNVRIDGKLIVEGTLICTHKGGTATCAEKAICDICKQAYGEFDASNHKDENGDYVCDFDCGYEYEKPEEPTPDTPDEPENNEVCPDCGRPVHEDEFNDFICMVLRLFKLIYAFVTMVK